MEPSPPLPPLPPPVSYTGLDKLLAVLCHLSLFFGFAFILPLAVFLIRNNESPLVAQHAKEVLNFHISLLIYSAVGVILIFAFLIGIPLLIALGVFAAVCAIIGAVRAAEGAVYYYPLTIRLIA